MQQAKLKPSSISLLCLGHIILITLSNVLVQYPFHLFGFITTWGAFTYPAIFILTDLTTRLSSPQNARAIVYRSMLPGLIISYVVASYLESSSVNGGDFLSLHVMPLRIALGCFCAYVIGQLLDIYVFQRFRASASWWIAPFCSSSMGNLTDTGLFFFIVFYHCSNPYLSQHWPEIATVDMFFKCLISLVAFIPFYGLVLQYFSTKTRQVMNVSVH